LILVASSRILYERQYLCEKVRQVLLTARGGGARRGPMQPRNDQGKLHPKAKPSGVPEPLEMIDLQKHAVCAVFHCGRGLSMILHSTRVDGPMPDTLKYGEMD
jgi:hypothetical protein